MKIVTRANQLQKKYKNPVVAIGVFDGLHKGHQKLLRYCVARARELKGTPLVMTFWPHPIHVLRPDIFLPLIISLPYRLMLIKKYGIKVCWVVRFTKRFAQLSQEQFIKKYLKNKIHPLEVVVGDDFRFGQNRSGSLDDFIAKGKEMGFTVKHLSVYCGHAKTVSSTRIRQLITEGEIGQVAKLLDRPLAIYGNVIRGDRRGKTLGYPTANINPAREIILPSGVFLVKVKLQNKIYNGLANIGRRPSFKRSNKVNIEVHILGFHKKIYGQEIVIEIIKKLRDEKKFSSKDDLIKQIRKDEKKARSYFLRKYPTK
ncbi:MAG: bifunctional riboflavin kinase/FAD synthetase [Candidatus Omnitrophica bacterium]|nr:bifunctional riboflavin kinase/FAD synthetase [Candidatus Omnitrophota bacterium]